jgi:hypothetical protein
MTHNPQPIATDTTGTATTSHALQASASQVRNMPETANGLDSRELRHPASPAPDATPDSFLQLQMRAPALRRNRVPSIKEFPKTLRPEKTALSWIASSCVAVRYHPQYRRDLGTVPDFRVTFMLKSPESDNSNF